MSGGGMEAPFSIASIPRPIDSANGRVYAAPVYGVRDLKKRKRHEVVVGIDGESVNLYNAQSQRSITSYALPPQSYLCCPPVSVYVRGATNKSARRVTYCVVKDGPKEHKRRLVSFAETVRKDAREPSGPERRECVLNDGQIANLDVVPRAVGSHVAVIVTYFSGSTFAVNGDLSNKVDLGRPKLDGPKHYEVEAATTVDVEAARKGLLKNREDVVATLNQMGASPIFQWRVIRTATSRQFQLLELKLSALDGIQSIGPRITTLMSFDLPSASAFAKTESHYELHAPSGTLYEVGGGKLSVYDLSGTVQRLVTRIGSRSAPVSSFSRLSTTSVLTVGGGIATVYETKYGSGQDSISLTTITSGTQPRKRKHEEIDSELGRFNLIAWFSELGQAMGICGSELMILQLPDTMSSDKRRKAHGTTLADVIGKGTVKETLALRKSEQQTEKLDLWRATVDELIAANDIEGLENLVANDAKLGRQRKSHDLRDLDKHTGLVYHDSAAYEELWPLPETFDPEKLNRHKILYLLGRIFSIEDALDGRLQILIRSTKLVEWLALIGFLSVASIRKAFQSSTDGISQTYTDLQPGDIMIAVQQIDEDFQLMHDLLHLPVHWDIEEVVQALRAILQSFNIDPPAEPQLALPAPQQINGEAKIPNGDADSELEVAENELDYAVSALTTGLEVRSDALRAIFARLHAFNNLDVTSTMRSMMSQEELFFLIHILRIELADGGWTSRYVDIGEGAAAEGGMVDTLAGIEESGPSDESIKVIGFLLNCAVDAIGISGWLVGLGGNWSAKELVESLRAEVSAGYEGCLEANTVKSFLAEIEKYTNQPPEQRRRRNMDEDDDNAWVVLPIGGKAVVPTSKTHHDKDERQRKIARAQEKSRSVGKYVYEEIRI